MKYYKLVLRIIRYHTILRGTVSNLQILKEAASHCEVLHKFRRY